MMRDRSVRTNIAHRSACHLHSDSLGLHRWVCRCFCASYGHSLGASRLLCLESCGCRNAWITAIWTWQTVWPSPLFLDNPHSLYRYKCPNIRTTLVCPGHVETSMFKNVIFPQFQLFKFFCPSLPPVTVVKHIIAALDDQHSQTLLMPFYVNFVPYVRHLPSFLRDIVQWVRRDSINPDRH